MNNRNDIVNEILNLMGGAGSRELAETMFDAMRADGSIFWAGDFAGLQIRQDVDLVAIAENILKSC